MEATLPSGILSQKAFPSSKAVHTEGSHINRFVHPQEHTHANALFGTLLTHFLPCLISRGVQRCLFVRVIQSAFVLFGL